MTDQISLSQWQRDLFDLAQTGDFSAFCDAVNQFGACVQNEDVIAEPVFAIGQRVKIVPDFYIERHRGLIFVVERIDIEEGFRANYYVSPTHYVGNLWLLDERDLIATEE